MRFYSEDQNQLRIANPPRSNVQTNQSNQDNFYYSSYVFRSSLLIPCILAGYCIALSWNFNDQAGPNPNSSQNKCGAAAIMAIVAPLAIISLPVCGAAGVIASAPVGLVEFSIFTAKHAKEQISGVQQEHTNDQQARNR